MRLQNELRYNRGNDRFRSLEGVYYGDERLSTEQFADLRASVSGSPPLRVENPYKKGRYLDGFSVDLISGAVFHKNIGSIAASSYLRLQPLAVLWEGAKVAERTEIGSFAEVRKRVQLAERVRLHGGSVVCRDGVIEPDVHIREGSYLASDIHVKAGSTIGTMNYFRTGSRIDSGVYTEANVYGGEHVHLGKGSTLKADVKVASFSPIGQGAVVNEGAIIGIIESKRPTGYVPAFGVVAAGALMIGGYNYARS
jgi:UDP-3-O-[3-hydroxymyristoyl] glucosamine N-acyltransferase